MHIEGVEAITLSIPFRPGGHAAAAVWGDSGLPTADSLLVKVTTDAGLVGWGEAFGFRAASTIKAAVDHMIAPQCIGRDVGAIVPLMGEIQRTLQVFGRSGPVMFGLSALDIALWDLAGKAAKAPVHQLLGGAQWSQLPCYASLSKYADHNSLTGAVRRALDAGFRKLKLHETEWMLVAAVRGEAGPDVEIMLDVNCAWTLDEARAQARALGPFGLRWLEEPVWPPENFEALAELRRTSGIPIAAGENASTLLEFDRLMTAGSVDFVQPSPAKMGGLTELVKVFALAAAHNVTVMLHSFYDGPGLLAAIHATAALGSASSLIEWRYFDLEANLYGSALSLADGCVAVPNGPGLGFDPDEDAIRAYTTAG